MFFISSIRNEFKINEKMSSLFTSEFFEGTAWGEYFVGFAFMTFIFGNMPLAKPFTLKRDK